MTTPSQTPAAAAPAQPRGATVWSDITHYARLEDVNELLEAKFPAILDAWGRAIKQYYIETNENGDHRVWAPEAISEDEKKELYDKAVRSRTLTDPSSWRRYA